MQTLRCSVTLATQLSADIRMTDLLYLMEAATFISGICICKDRLAGAAVTLVLLLLNYLADEDLIHMMS